jgi:transaldolase
LHPPANRNTDNKLVAATKAVSTQAAARSSPAAVAAKNKLILAAVAAAKTKRMTQQDFRYRLNMDACGTELLARGIRAWINDVERLEKIIATRVLREDAQKSSPRA